MPALAHALDEPSRLALAYQAGARSALGELYESVRPLIGAALARYRRADVALPTTLDRDDLAQETWLLLADLALRWDPSLGPFGAYVNGSLKWRLARRVKQHSPSRRRRGLLVMGACEPDVEARLERIPGEDGRAWDERLAWGELLDRLPPDERRVVALRVGEQRSLSDIERTTGMDRSSVRRAYRRGLRRLQSPTVEIGERIVEARRGRPDPELARDLAAVVEALHALARPTGIAPGRLRIEARTGLPESRVNRLLDLLARAGCIAGRRGRRSGRLVHATAAETLAALRIRPGLGAERVP